MRHTASVILMKDGLILGVSRKNDHTSFSLVGGKVEPNEDIITALKRECKEETGLDITDIVLANEAEYNGYMEHTYTATAVGEINYDFEKEPHIVKWVTPDTILKGAFGDYNKIVFDKLGIK